ncbi:transcriptional regulator, SARP family [Kribbella flavida DSM 17836]|uniref:Transcriptional regulator, SARP family n=1 Tax=Kribbella flavida (strain DSM 17836 / JCM 10339 / NBRC 14399) TaxID=479435 RepID=D2Q1J5_KRIFD|nr:BTAD domain-containing putative transcriptional regulator [Kribbella flavida]ADB30183.1 transcriptional regulator, SARP family [Kribbella flavida DSM 17836]
MDRLRLELLGVPRGFVGERAFDLGPVRQQALLAVLALNANHVLTAEELLSTAWGDAAPASGAKVVAPYVYRVRQALPNGDVLRRTRHGYVLDLEPDELDVTMFEATVADARRTTDRQQAAALFAAALDLFSGEPLAGLPGRYLASERHRLTELRRKVQAERIELDLALGRYDDVIAELIARVEDDPLDEQATGQLMIALYRAGRQADALDAYARTRAALISELGVEPGPSLRAAHQVVLANESQAAEPPQPGRDELPYGGSAFVGRSEDLRRLTTALTHRQVMPLVCVDGMAGIGKTTLAVRAAREVAGHFPDGRLFVDLLGHTSGRPPMRPEQALNHLLRGLGTADDQIPSDLTEAAALWRSQTATRRLLVVLDNAPDSDTVRHLLPGAPGCAVVVTSRSQLTGLDPSVRIGLPALTAEDAANLIATVSGRDRSDPALTGLVERCGRIPLALSIAGSKLRHRHSWTIAHLNDRMDAKGNRLAELSVDGRSVTTAFMVSYEQLPSECRRLLRLVSLVPGRDVDRYVAAALTDTAPDSAEDALDALVDANMLLENGPGRYRLHDLIREFATGLPSTEAETARDRLLAYYAAAARAAGVQLLGDPPFERRPVLGALPALGTSEQATAWVAQEVENVLDALDWAVDNDRPAAVVDLTLGIYPAVFTNDRLDLCRRLLAEGLAAARRVKDREAECYFLVQSAWIELTRHDREAGLEVLDQAIELARDLGSRNLQAYAAAQLGRASLRMGRPARAIEQLARVVELSGSLSPRIATTYHHTLAICYWVQGRHAEALACARAAYAAAESGGLRLRMTRLLGMIALCQVELRQPAESLATMRRLTDLGAPMTPWSSAELLTVRGTALEQLGDIDGALESHHRALEQAVATGNPDAEAEVRLRLGGTLLAAGNHRRGADEFTRVLALVQSRAATFDRARALAGLTDCLTAAGETEQAARHREEALSIYRELGSVEVDRWAANDATLR